MPARPLMLATLDGFAVEGGYDGPSGPATSFGAATHLAQCAPTGEARGLWEPGQYEAVLDAAAAIGLRGVRVTLEWARLEPHPDRRDPLALARYRNALDHARQLGLHVTGVLIDAAWPSWLGPDAWLMPWVLPRALAHAEWLVESVGDLLDGLVAVARPTELVESGYLFAIAPPWRSRAAADAASATKSLTSLGHALSASSTVAPLLTSGYREVPVVDAPALASLLANTRAHEIHLRSLVRGVGPAASAGGLVERVDGRWLPAVDASVRQLL